jgi:hypothetical protein
MNGNDGAKISAGIGKETNLFVGVELGRIPESHHVPQAEGLKGTPV